jgi:phage terminase large subunit GpA-like protein
MTYEISKSELAALTPPDQISVAAWVESHRIINKGSAEPGPKRISRTPNIAALYDWFGDHTIREITVQKPAQCGLTDAIVDLILWISENDPAPVALFLADQDTARKLMKYRITPALAELGRVRVSKDNRDKDITKFECTLSNGFYLMVSWGSSISQTASMAFKYVFCDEINKPGYDVSKDEGSALGRIRERMETYPDSKFIKFSTPTTDEGRVTQELSRADVVYDYQAPCHKCGTFQALSFKQVRWDGGSKATSDQIEASARYICSACAAEWTTTEKNAAVEKGAFVARSQAAKPKHVGLQLHRLSSLFKGGRLEDMIERWNKANLEGPGEMQNVINSVFGEPWVQRISGTEDDRILKLRRCIAAYPKNTIPAEAACLVAGVDVQQQGFYYRVRAFAPDLTSWGIDEGFCTTWDNVAAVLFDGNYGRPIWRALIDTGGGKDEGALISRTEETYLFLRANMGRGVQLMGSKGSSRSASMAGKIKIGASIEKTPSGKPIPGGLRIAQINTQAFKDALWWRIEKTETGEPGAWYLHLDTPDWALNQIAAEEKRIDRNGVAEWHQVKKDNHLLDCEVLCLACVDAEFWGGLRGVKMQQARQQVTQQRTQPAQKQHRVNPYVEEY